MCLWTTEVGIGSPGARVTGCCELPHVGSGKQTQDHTRSTCFLTTAPSLWPHISPVESKHRFRIYADWCIKYEANVN